MKNSLRFLIIALFVFTSCDNLVTSEISEVPDSKTEIGKINDLLKQFEEPSQTFKVSSDQPSQVTGQEGTIISINPADLTTEKGNSLGKNIEVELKELTNQEQLLRTNAQTTSNGQMLVSGGAYYINMTSEGEQLKLKEGKTLSVEFPKITSDEMSLFYGQRDSLGKLNWIPAEQKFENIQPQKTTDDIKTDKASRNEIDEIFDYVEEESNRILTPEEKQRNEDQDKNFELGQKLYKTMELNQFGWINCDKFYNVQNKTNLNYSFADKESISNALVYLVFKDINSVIQNCYNSEYKNEDHTRFQNVPSGSRVRLIAFSIKNGKTYTHTSDFTIKENETIQLNLKETAQEDLDKLFPID